MSDKKAFVFDTNFIIQHKKLDEVVENLKEQFTVYITQVSIDELIAQECRKLREKFEKFKSIEEEYSNIASMELISTYEKCSEYCRNTTQKDYISVFGKNIIPFSKDETTFASLIARANDKFPPFSNDPKASDKGFKDYLLWHSLLKYFRDNGEDNVVFLTDDKSAFTNHTDFLTKEFAEVTRKSIEFHQNAFYNKLLKSSEEIESETTLTPLPSLETLRVEIEIFIKALCEMEYTYFNGRQSLKRTFITSQMFDKEYVKSVFDNLQNVILKHLFEQKISATEVLDIDGRIENRRDIPIKNLENALNLYHKMLKHYAGYIDQFYEAVAKIFNDNYFAPGSYFDDDDDLPF